MVWALALHALRHGLGRIVFSAWTWSGYWLWTGLGIGFLHALRHGLGKIVLALGHGLGIGFACPQTWSGENSFSAQDMVRVLALDRSGHWLCMFSDMVWEK